jgi:hypothetical protein
MHGHACIRHTTRPSPSLCLLRRVAPFPFFLFIGAFSLFGDPRPRRRPPPHHSELGFRRSFTVAAFSPLLSELHHGHGASPPRLGPVASIAA